MNPNDNDPNNPFSFPNLPPKPDEVPPVNFSSPPPPKKTFQTGELETGDFILAMVCPGIGCIMSLLWFAQGNPKASKMFGYSFLFSLLWAFLRIVITAAAKG